MANRNCFEKILIYEQKGGESTMQKGTEAFSEMEDNGLENELLDALVRERSAIEKIEREKEENSFMEETVTAPTSKKKLWRDTQKEALARLEDSARTEEDFRNVQSWWDRLEANADRRYRYHVAFGCSSGMGCSTGGSRSPRTDSVRILETDNKRRISGHHL